MNSNEDDDTEELTIAGQLDEAADLHHKEYINHTIEELKRLRHWFAGYASAGGKLPSVCTGLDVLWKSQIILENHLKMISLTKQL